MSLERSQRIAVTRQVVGGNLDFGVGFGPQDYFVLSRIEGRPSVGEVLDSAGLPSAQTQAILGRLLTAGAIEVVEAGAPAPAASGSASSTALRAQASERRRRTLARGLGTGQMREAPTREVKPVTDPTKETKETPRVDAAPPPPFELPPVPMHDARLDPSLALPVDEQRRLLALLDRGEELTAFEMLGLHPTHDAGLIRNAFRQASRRFHPDAHHGRELGPFAARLGRLFAGAKDAVKRLGDEAYRTPLVDAYEGARAQAQQEEQRRQARMDAAKLAAEEIRTKRDREDVEERRRARMVERAQAQRGRVLANLSARVGQHLADAQTAERLGHLASAANHYRLALRVDPNLPDVKAKWEQVRTLARKERAKEAFSRANSYLELGQSTEALPLLVEAADADPTPDHLAAAADLLRSVDIGRARDMMMEALNALHHDVVDLKGRPRPPSKLAEIHMVAARVFRDAGQKKTAKAQAKLAQELTPDNPDVRALLNSIKVK